jgi:hypothetical protein
MRYQEYKEVLLLDQQVYWNAGEICDKKTSGVRKNIEVELPLVHWGRAAFDFTGVPGWLHQLIAAQGT